MNLSKEPGDADPPLRSNLERPWQTVLFSQSVGRVLVDAEALRSPRNARYVRTKVRAN